jgi:hypothetical protein
MVDIVRWLRDVAEDWRCEEAADEIERLLAREARMREALEKIVRVPLWDEYKCIEIARTALEEEKK